MYRANQLLIKSSFKQASLKLARIQARPALCFTREYSIKSKINDTLHDLNESTKGASKIIEKTEDLTHKAKTTITNAKEAISDSTDDLKSKAHEAKGQVKTEAKHAKKTAAKKADEAADKVQDKADEIKKNLN